MWYLSLFGVKASPPFLPPINPAKLKLVDHASHKWVNGLDLCSLEMEMAAGGVLRRTHCPKSRGDLQAKGTKVQKDTCA